MNQEREQTIEAEMIEIISVNPDAISPELKLEPQDTKSDKLPPFANRLTVNLEAQEEEVTEVPSKSEQSIFSNRAETAGRVLVFLICIGFLLIGRFSVPDNEVTCVRDIVLDGLQFANNFINTQGNEHFRDGFQTLCSIVVDGAFVVTFGYWVLYGKTCRLPITLAVFYLVRGLIQKIWFSPFPPGFYWSSPGLPSLVVPYGRGSDFFFSGHAGFMIICAEEWHRIGKPRMRNMILIGAAYTIFTLLIYRIHYSIDIFVGVFFADWCFWKVDSIREKLDNLWISAGAKAKGLYEKIGKGDNKVLLGRPSDH
jgi:hypothetical protein